MPYLRLTSLVDYCSDVMMGIEITRTRGLTRWLSLRENITLANTSTSDARGVKKLERTVGVSVVDGLNA